MKNKLRSSFNSRQYMLSSDFEVYYYSDRDFKTLSPHAHDYYECYLFLEGDVTMEIFGGSNRSRVMSNTEYSIDDNIGGSTRSRIANSTEYRIDDSIGGNANGRITISAGNGLEDNSINNPEENIREKELKKSQQDFIPDANDSLPDMQATEKYRMTPGDLMIVPPGVRHHAIMHESEKNYRRFVFWISKDCCKSLMSESIDYMYLMQKAEAFHKYIYHLPPNQFHQAQSKFLRLLEETNADRYGSDAFRHVCLCDLILTLNRIIYDEEHRHSGNDELTLFQNIISYVEENLEEQLSLEDIAGKFFVSKYYIAHLFKDTLGISLHQYIIKKRLFECRDAITSGEPITSAYERFGFRDYSSFFKAFRKEYGMSPKEYQNIYSTTH